MLNCRGVFFIFVARYWKGCSYHCNSYQETISNKIIAFPFKYCSCVLVLFCSICSLVSTKIFSLIHLNKSIAQVFMDPEMDPNPLPSINIFCTIRDLKKNHSLSAVRWVHPNIYIYIHKTYIYIYTYGICIYIYLCNLTMWTPKANSQQYFCTWVMIGFPMSCWQKHLGGPLGVIGLTIPKESSLH